MHEEFWRNNIENYNALIKNNNSELNKYFDYYSMKFSLQKYLTRFFLIKKI